MSEELHSSLLNELRRTSTATSLEPTLILERDSLGKKSLFFFFFFFTFFRSVAFGEAASQSRRRGE